MSINGVDQTQITQSIRELMKPGAVQSAKSAAPAAPVSGADRVELGGVPLDGSVLHRLDPQRVSALLS